MAKSLIANGCLKGMEPMEPICSKVGIERVKKEQKENKRDA